MGTKKQRIRRVKKRNWLTRTSKFEKCIFIRKSKGVQLEIFFRNFEKCFTQKSTLYGENERTKYEWDKISNSRIR